MAENNTVAVIMAGGSGTRFWPLSRKAFPKQYLTLHGNRTLIQSTLDRVVDVIPPDRVFVCTTSSQVDLVRKQIPQIKGMILEPAAKNTAPCLMLSVAQLLRQGYSKETVMAVFPADHIVKKTESFHHALNQAISFARSTGGLITFGIQPDHPHTGYGYIEGGVAATSGFFSVKKFVEKPNLETARKYLAAGNFFWNGGIFVWTLQAITEAFEKFLPQEWKEILGGLNSLEIIYPKLTPQPIDTAIFEKASNVYVLPVEMGWSDVGSWGALHELKDKDKDQNATLTGEVHYEESQGCLVHASKKTVLIGVKDLVIVDTGDTLLVLNRHEDQRVRNVADS